jgi:hypothetical protein
MVRNLLLIMGAAMLPATAAHAQGAAKPISRNDFVKSVDSRFNTMDTNHDGKVTRDELTAELQRELQQANARIAQQLETKFRQLDTNKDGQLSLKEFMAVQPGLHSNETPEQMMQRLDTNHDGKVSVDEFRAPDLAKFNAADANHDGVVTPAEAQAYAAAHQPH